MYKKKMTLIVEDNKTLIEPESKKGLIFLGGGTVGVNKKRKDLFFSVSEKEGKKAKYLYNM